MINIVSKKVAGKIVIRLSILLGIISLLAIGFFTFFSSSSHTISSDKISSKQMETTFEINEWSHWLLYYDEVLTQSARNYAYSEDIKWKNRYDKTLNDLYKLIALILSRSKNKELNIFTEFEKVNNKLADLEISSFEAMRQHQPQKAIAILDSKRYEKYKIQYQNLIQNYLKVKQLNYKNSFNKFKNNTLYVIKYNKERTTFISATFFFILVLFIVFTSMLIWFVVKRIKKITMFVDQIIVGDDFSSYEANNKNDLDEYVSSIIQTLKTSRVASDKLFNVEMRTQIEALRNEFKRNLHDRLGVLVSATKLHFYLLKPEIQQPEIVKHYQTCLKLLDQTFSEIKQLSTTNDTASTKPLLEEMQALVSFFSSTKAIDIAFDFDIQEEVLSPSQKECIELIVREALNNTIRHAKARYMSIAISYVHPHILLDIKDDGVGFESEQLIRKNGLNHMHERVNQLHGKFNIRSKIGQGTHIEVVL